MAPRKRAEVSRRLKAARHLAGVTVAQLAARDVLKANGISANLIGETERLERDARPMELRAIAEALKLPEWFFTADLAQEAPDTGQLDRIETALAERADHDGKVSLLLEQQNELLARQSDILTRIEHLLGTLTLTVEDQEPAESTGFAVPRVRQSLVDALNPQLADQRREEETRRKRGSRG